MDEKKWTARLRAYGISVLRRRDLTTQAFQEKLRQKFLSGSPGKNAESLTDEEKEKIGELAQQITEDFVRRGFLDDRAWAETFIENHRYGGKKLAWALRRQGIDPALWEGKLEENKERELLEIRKLIGKQEGKDRQKVIASLLRRGFALEDIQKAFSNRE